MTCPAPWDTAGNHKSFKSTLYLLNSVLELLRWFQSKPIHPSMNNSYVIKFPLLMLLAGTCLVDGCVHRDHQQPSAPATTAATVGTEVVVDRPPPMPVVETMDIAPGPGFVWIPGAWVWRTQWVWDRGHWAHPPQPDAVWVAPRYEDRGTAQVFIQGGWKY